jgi:calcium-dependent protein kinase
MDHAHHSHHIINPAHAPSSLALSLPPRRTLDHPNIIRIHEVFKTEFTLYIVMEQCTGGELFDELERCPKMQMPEAEFKDITYKILTALTYLHANGIAHRDLKLENFIFTSKNKSTRTLKMIDFGYSRTFLEGDVMDTLVGTAFYIAPEVLDGAYTQEADLWSLGCMIYMMATGEIPIPGRNDAEVMRNVMKAKERKVQYGSRAVKLGVRLSAECADLINKLMTVDPGSRPTAAAALDHPWFTTSTLSTKKLADKETRSNSDIEEACANIRAFRGFSLLKRLASVAISVHLESEGLNNLERIFTSMDKDHTGTLTHDEFRNGLHKTSIPDVEIEKMFSAVDQDHTGHIKYAEFLAACVTKKVMMNKRNLISAFNALDIDGDGTITKSELKQLLGPDVDDAALDNLIAQCDFHKDGVITKEEFIRAMRGEKVGDPAAPVATVVSSV